MNKNVIYLNWIRTLESWTPSKGAIRLCDDKVYNIVMLLDYIANSTDPDKLVPMGLKVFMSLQADSLYKSELFDIAAKQAREHRQIWRTHLDELNFLTFELPYFHQRAFGLRYFKVKILKKYFDNFNKIQCVYFSYHPSNCKTEVLIL